MEVLSIGTIVLVVINIVAVAFSYGKLTQKVSDLCRRIDSIDKRLNDLSHRFESTEERIRSLEIQK